jgi:type I restriction enzyme, S subunit
LEVKEPSARYLARPGYKQTESGVLPADWDAGPIGRAVEKLEAGASVNSEKDEESEFDSYPCILKTGAAREGSLDPRESKKVARRDLWRLKVSLRKDTILVSRMNTLELVGESGYVDADYPNLFVPDRMWMTTIRKARVHSRWLSYILTWQPVRSRISASATGTSGSMKNISKPSFRSVAIPYPPLEEQRVIAEALSDSDALIESLEQLLAKKRQLKQGAMQELLTGKKRLRGFSEKWGAFCLGHIADPNQQWSFTGGPFGSNLKSSDYTETGIRIIQLQNIGDGEFKDNYEVYTSQQKADELLSCNIFPGEIILSKMGDPVARACLIPSREERYVMCSDGIRLAVDKSRFNVYFIFAQINAPEFRSRAANAGTGTTRKRIGLTELRALELRCPPLLEQDAIAAILSDMDTEISILEAKLSKARQIKQGMVQALLTGTIRLI